MSCIRDWYGVAEGGPLFKGVTALSPALGVIPEKEVMLEVMLDDNVVRPSFFEAAATFTTMPMDIPFGSCLGVFAFNCGVAVDTTDGMDSGVLDCKKDLKLTAD